MSRNKRYNHPKPPAQNGLALLLLVAALVVTLWIAGRNLLGDDYIPIRWANFAAPWVFIASLGLIIWALLKKLYLPMAALIWPLAIALSTTPGIIFETENAAAQFNPQNQTKISVLSFNVGRFNQRYDKISTLISNSQADIIFLQEVTSPIKLMATLSAKSITPAYKVQSFKTTGLVLLTRYEILSANRLPGVLTRYKIGHPLGKITLWNIHVPRSIWSTTGQKKVITNLLADMQRHPGRKIIAGDFNLTPYNDAVQQVTISSGNLAATAKALTRPFTYPTPVRRAGLIGPWVQIDHIIASRHFHAQSAVRLPNYAGSDHYPISTQLIFRGNAYTGRDIGKGEGEDEGADGG